MEIASIVELHQILSKVELLPACWDIPCIIFD